MQVQTHASRQTFDSATVDADWEIDREHGDARKPEAENRNDHSLVYEHNGIRWWLIKLDSILFIDKKALWATTQSNPYAWKTHLRHE